MRMNKYTRIGKTQNDWFCTRPHNSDTQYIPHTLTYLTYARHDTVRDLMHTKSRSGVIITVEAILFGRRDGPAAVAPGDGGFGGGAGGGGKGG